MSWRVSDPIVLNQDFVSMATLSAKQGILGFHRAVKVQQSSFLFQSDLQKSTIILSIFSRDNL